MGEPALTGPPILYGGKHKANSSETDANDATIVALTHHCSYPRDDELFLARNHCGTLRHKSVTGPYPRIRFAASLSRSEAARQVITRRVEFLQPKQKQVANADDSMEATGLGDRQMTDSP